MYEVKRYRSFLEQYKNKKAMLHNDIVEALEGKQDYKELVAYYVKI